MCLLLDARDGRVMRTLKGHTNPVAAAAFSPDGKTLATAGQDALVCLWSLERDEPPRVLRGHTSRVYAVAFSPDGTRLASGANDATIRLWDPDRGDELLEITGHEAYVFSLAFSPNGDRLVSGSGDDTVRLWSTLPLAARWASSERERALEAEVEPGVARRLAAASPAAVVAALESDPALDAPQRRAALAVALRLSAAR